ncbi:MAG: CesT family type III secretion system chaperone [Leptolyngbyaceae cyanobacterium CSU_1_3]|nr:CesT family type III secretion system chaperone [Leptolyngbyaceae cyanobacterium CSU_1_3]
MTPEELPLTLTHLFGNTIQALAPGSYQVETPEFRLLVLLSDDQSWLRVLLPIAPAQDARPYLEELLEASFDTTQETRYALHQGVLWAVFQHSCEGLTIADFSAAIERLLFLNQQGLNESFSVFVEKRIRQIIQAAKRQGQSLELTLQTLDRFYAEGVMGEMAMGSQSREEVLTAWQRQLTRLWADVDP